MTVHRSKDFLKWRVFDNPYVNCKFTAFFFNKKPLGYVIYTTNGGNLSITDIIIVPYNSVINTKLIINEVLDFLDQYCAKKKLNYCKFELYLNHKLNNLIYNQLIKVGYIKKEINTDFSFKILNKNINNKLIKNSYITNINRSGKHN